MAWSLEDVTAAGLACKRANGNEHARRCAKRGLPPYLINGRKITATVGDLDLLTFGQREVLIDSFRGCRVGSVKLKRTV